LQGRSDLAARLLAALLCLWAALVAHWVRTREVFAGIGSSPRFDRGRLALGTITRAPLVGDAFTTGC
jgi:hypothetical protein